MPSATSKIGVVGASGFIGRELVERLAADEKVGLRLFGRSTGKVGNSVIEKLDLSPRIFRDLDCIVHLSGITTSRATAAALHDVNVDLAAAVASAAVRDGVKRLVFISSLHVHGKSALAPISPDSIFNPDNAYGRSKAAAEAALGRIAGASGMELVILRPPMVYGASAKGSFSLLLRLIKTGLPLPLALARGRRSFCSVGNLVSAIRHAVEASSPPAVMIPADPEDFDPRELVRTMAAALGRQVRLWPAPKVLLAAPLAAFGRSEVITSLFAPLQVDRNHWHTAGWRPVEAGLEAVTTALQRPQSPSPVLLYITNSTPYFFSHRLAFAREAMRRGFRVALAGGDTGPHRDRIEAEGILPVTIPGGLRGIDPVGDLRAGLALSAHIRRLNVRVVHATGLKTIFLCALAQLAGRLPRTVCVVTGLGSTYTDQTFKSRLMQRFIEAAIRPLLRHPLTTTVFQNRDDKAHFIKRGISRAENSVTIKGSGVDIEEFSYVAEPRGNPPLVVFPARLLKSKGVLVFAQAASMLKSRGLKARFALVGEIDTANPDSLTRDELSEIIQTGSVEAWGFQTDMAKIFARSNLVCLPSFYREGVPKALIEAASIGRALITADVPGCREIVQHEKNGLLVPPRDALALASALEVLIRDRGLRRLMGTASRSIVEAEFAMELVLNATVDLYGRPSI